MKLSARYNFNHRRWTACGELTIEPSQRFFGGWFFMTAVATLAATVPIVFVVTQA